MCHCYWLTIWFVFDSVRRIRSFFAELNEGLTRELAELKVGNLFHQSSNFNYFDCIWFMIMILIKKLWILFLFYFVFLLWYMMMFMHIWLVYWIVFDWCSIELCLFIFLILAEADSKTHHDRYLLIATSGGLNQQRTGGKLINFFSQWTVVLVCLCNPFN
jgi:hypothetical protein